MTLHSIVIPVFNEEEALTPLFSVLTSTFKASVDDRWEFIFVDDGSDDHTPEMLSRFCDSYRQARVVTLSRQFGHQAALCAGIDAARGDTITTLDADLQDPPQLVYEFVSLWRQGYKVIYGIRRSRQGDGVFKRLSAHIFYLLLYKIAHVKIPIDVGDFCLIDRQVANALCQLPERNRYLRGLITWIGFKQVGVPYDRSPRSLGRTKYPFRRMIKLALDGIVSLSVIPLRFLTLSGISIVIFSLFAIIDYFSLGFLGQAFLWYAFVAFLAGIQLLGMGILGEYLGRILDEVRSRPLYITRDRSESSSQIHHENSA